MLILILILIRKLVLILNSHAGTAAGIDAGADTDTDQRLWLHWAMSDHCQQLVQWRKERWVVSLVTGVVHAV
jgi:hypothetical protein